MKGIDGYTHAKDAHAQALLSALLAEAFADPTPWERATRRQVAEVLTLESRASAAAILGADARLHEELLLALGERIDAITQRPGYYAGTAFSAYSSDPGWHQQNVLELLFARLLRKRLPYHEETLVALLGLATRHHGLSALAIVGHVERALGGARPAGALRQAVHALLDVTPKWHRTLKLHERLASLLAGPPAAAKPVPAPRSKSDPRRLLAGIDEPWLEVLRERIDSAANRVSAWRDVLALAEETRERSQPTKRWLEAARRGIEAIGPEGALEALTAVFEAVPELQQAGDRHSAKQLANAAAELLRALAWSVGAMASMEDPGRLVVALQDATLALFTRVENIGARDAKAGAGAITGLGLLAAGGCDDAVVALLELGDRLEYQAGQQAVRRALASAAKARKTSTDQLARAAVLAAEHEDADEDDDEAAAAARAATVEAALQVAVEAQRRGDAAQALSATLNAWRACKSETLSPAIEALSHLAGAERPPLGGNKEERHARWLELARLADPGDLPRLLAALDRENQRLALEQFRALDRWPADPRLAAALCELLETPPYRHQRTWVALCSVLVGQTDPRTKPRLAQIDLTKRRRRGERDPWRVELGELRAALAIRYPREAPLSAPAAALLDELSALLPAPAAASKAGRTSTRQADEVLAEIYANPADDDLRRLYADLLLEGGDERGELITLQLLADKSPAQKKRERELLAAHALDWLGPLAPVFQRSGLRYARGFAVAGRINGKQLAANDKLVGLPLWSTFEELAVKGWEVPVEALTHPVLRGLRVLEGAQLETAAVVLGQPTAPARALERLRCALYRDDEDVEDLQRWQLALTAAGAPALRELIVDSQLDAATLNELLASPLGRQLKHLSVEVGYSDAPASLGRLSKLRVAPARLTLHETFRHWNLTLSRGKDGRWSQLACSYEGRPDDETRRRLDELLARLPAGAIRELSR